jgi:hypothetical protein
VLKEVTHLIGDLLVNVRVVLAPDVKQDLLTLGQSLLVTNLVKPLSCYLHLMPLVVNV